MWSVVNSFLINHCNFHSHNFPNLLPWKKNLQKSFMNLQENKDNDTILTTDLTHAFVPLHQKHKDANA